MNAGGVVKLHTARVNRMLRLVLRTQPRSEISRRDSGKSAQRWRDDLPRRSAAEAGGAALLGGESEIEIYSEGVDLSRLGSGERNSAKPKARQG